MKQKMARFSIDRSDPAYPALRRFKGIGRADGYTTFNTLGEAKKALISELKFMRDHYSNLMSDVRKTTIKQLDDEAYPDY